MFDQVARTSAVNIASAIVLEVANIDSPSELNSRAGGTNGSICLVTQNVAGINAWTLYAFDASSSGSVNSPYVLASSDGGQWVAFAGKRVNSAFNVSGAASLVASGTGRVNIGTRTDDGSTRLQVSFAGTQIFKGINTAASGASGGASFSIGSDDGAAMGTGDRISSYFVQGATDSASTMVNSAGIIWFATENWSGTAAGTKLTIALCANGSVARTTRATFDQDGSFILGTDPGGSSLLRVGGSATLSGALTIGGDFDANAQIIKNFVAEVVIYTGTSLSVSAAHRGRVISTTATGSVTITLPASLGAGFPVTVVQKGAGQITFAGGSGTTLNNRQTQYKAAGQYAICTVISDAADSWILGGDTGA